MCRLYALQASEPTRVECSLVKAQNALMEQSRGDEHGLVHGHGWGVADYPDGLPIVEKQTWAAYHGEHFKKKAARVYARTVVAHVRRATVGAASLENTHPFVHGRWIFAHNGTVPNFSLVRNTIVEAMDPLHRNEIHGTTDSEIVFRYILSRLLVYPEIELLENVRLALRRIIKWSQEIDPKADVSLNIVLTDGSNLVGSRFGRTLWFLERDQIFICDICGKSHVHHKPKVHYHSVEIASEMLTDEPGWRAVPNESVYAIDSDYKIRLRALN